MASVFLWCAGSGVPGLSLDLLIGFTPDVSGIADYAVLQTIAVSVFHFKITKGWVLAGFTSLLPSSNHAPKSFSIMYQEASSVLLIFKDRFSNELAGQDELLLLRTYMVALAGCPDYHIPGQYENLIMNFHFPVV